MRRAYYVDEMLKETKRSQGRVRVHNDSAIRAMEYWRSAPSQYPQTYFTEGRCSSLGDIRQAEADTFGYRPMNEPWRKKWRKQQKSDRIHEEFFDGEIRPAVGLGTSRSMKRS